MTGTHTPPSAMPGSEPWPALPQASVSVGDAVGSVLLKWLISLLLLLFALLAVGIAMAAVIGVMKAPDPTLAEDGAVMADALAIPFTVIFLAVFFPALGLAALFWIKVVEKRSLASAGLRGPAAFARYLRGLLSGVVLAILLTTVGGVLAAAAGFADEETGPLSFARVADPGFLQLIAIAVALLLVQSASEEVVCRGWMLSSLALRTGLVTAIVGSSLWFGLLHADRAFIDPQMGVLVIAGTAMVGFAFAKWAIAEQGIFGVCGAHGGYNATLVAMSLVMAIAAGEAETPVELIQQFMTDFEAEIAAPGAWTLVVAQLVVFGGLALLAPRLFASRAQEG